MCSWHLTGAVVNDPQCPPLPPLTPTPSLKSENPRKGSDMSRVSHPLLITQVNLVVLGKGRKRLIPFLSVQFSRSVVSDCLRPHESQHARPPCPSPAPGIYSNSCPSSRWCHPTTSSSVIPFSSCPQSLPSSGSFPVSQLFSWSGQSIGVSASASVLPMNTQDWSPLGWTAWISLQSKGLSRVFSNTTVQKHQFLGAQLSSQSNSHIHTWPLEKPQPWLYWLCWQSNVSAF